MQQSPEALSRRGLSSAGRWWKLGHRGSAEPVIRPAKALAETSSAPALFAASGGQFRWEVGTFNLAMERRSGKGLNW